MSFSVLFRRGLFNAFVDCLAGFIVSIGYIQIVLKCIPLHVVVLLPARGVPYTILGRYTTSSVEWNILINRK